jgi:DNA (cytosine-5)-methyltransferase 1
MSRPVLLDLFCGAGGAAVGYHKAGFDVIGVDKEPMPHFPFKFYQADAIAYLDAMLTFGFTGIDAIHASPPCQHWSIMSNCQPGTADKYPQLIAPVRKRLIAIGLPYVIENVKGSPLVEPVQLCGSSFGLRVNRHRFFEANFPIPRLACAHARYVMNPHNAVGRRRMQSLFGVAFGELERTWVREMGLGWMTLREARESFPVAYTEHIGAALAAWLAEGGARVLAA